MLRIEMEYMEAVKTIAREMRKANSEQPAKEPNWEQRHYELARDLYVRSVTSDDHPIKCGALAKTAIEQANVFINTLKEKQANGEKGK